MLIRPWKPSPAFPQSDDTLFRGCWEYELSSGENTIPRAPLTGQEINIVLEGKGLITVGDLTREVCQGEMVFIPPQTAHSVQNPFPPPLRGLTVEATLPVVPSAGGNDERVTLRDLEETIAAIPKDLDAPQALQIIIRLFDLAGFLSEQIEHAIGLDTQTGLDALASIETKVMDAVVDVSRAYGGGILPHPRRF